ncbi:MULTISPECIES: type III pantothenate kinase [Prochlorococcus]|uniref:type III pantothenate kinase n=1 Tax=Prochlorococcus TaxID=1218 RepID=UPI0005339446|nr:MULTISPECIES: type III pantothenate kinase [Prochlorococcus]KGG13301.1 Pantothenate kinase type III [Prochlorococcus sp. MIT 0601]
MSRTQCCLLIGNSRWHWACKSNQEWHFSHTSPNPHKLNSDELLLVQWAAVGEVPHTTILEKSKKLRTKDIPLLNLPEWLGVDRALGCWAALQEAKAQGLNQNGILIADAGTVFSLTKLTSAGEFEGGQLIPGLKLQQKAMALGAENLKEPLDLNIPSKMFPSDTKEAMLKGSFQSLIGALLEARKESSTPIWICGGDSLTLYRYLIQFDYEIIYSPNLVLEGMVGLLH